MIGIASLPYYSKGKCCPTIRQGRPTTIVPGGMGELDGIDAPLMRIDWPMIAMARTE